MNLRPVLFVLGILVCILAAGMIVPILVDLSAGYADWQVFAACMALSGFAGGALILTNVGDEPAPFGVREAFALTTTAWVAIAIFGALPFIFSELALSPTDAIFETVSGITTTGSSVIASPEAAPPGILIWRALLQWLGGVGIIITAMSVLPFLNVGGMQLFKTEMGDGEKVLPRTAALTSAISLIYVALTAACVLSYMAVGMGGFDAAAHAMSTISTGGFSTFDASFGGRAGPGSEMVTVVFMLAGAMPFILYLKAVRGDIGALLNDAQVRGFVAIVVTAAAVMILYLVTQEGQALGEAARRAVFNVVSVITGTGYVSCDYGAWGGFAGALLFFLTFMGGCAGSTACGIKVFRVQVLWAVSAVQARRLLHPHGVFMAHYNGRPLDDDVPLSVMSFFFLYILTFVVMAIALSYVGLDFLTATSGAATTLSNVGPGLGEIIGPAGNFSSLPDAAKWILTAGMLLGRLEIFTVLVLFVPRFWAR